MEESNIPPRRKVGRPRKNTGDPTGDYHYHFLDEPKIKPKRIEHAENPMELQARINKETNERFFSVLDKLVDDKKYRSRWAVVAEITGDKTIISRLLENIHMNLNTVYLWGLVTKHNVDPRWLLTGKGRMFKTKRNQES